MIEAAAGPALASAAAPRPFRAAWRRICRHPGAGVGALILAVALLSGLLGPRITPLDPQRSDLRARLLAPLSDRNRVTYYLGTDNLGRDVLSRVIVGARPSLTVGLLSVLGSGAIGVTLGLLGGYFGGTTDWVVRTVIDIQMSVPFILLALAAVAIFQPGISTLVWIFIATSWFSYARPVRAMVFSVREHPFIEAARALGCAPWRVLTAHILPNVLGVVAVVASFEVARIIVVEASLSFLGVGVPPTTPSWGSMIADGRGYVRDAWWMAAAPGLALTTLAVGVYLIGDSVRDALDPVGRNWRML